MARSEDSDVTAGKRQRRALLRVPLAGVCAVVFVMSAGTIVSAQNKPPAPISGCLPTAEMMTRLKAEGQRSVIVGNRLALIDEKNDRFVNERAMNVITMNADGSRGYNIEANAAIGKPTTLYCVRANLQDVRLHDVQNRSIPSDLSNVKYLSKAFSNGIGLMLTARAGTNGNVLIVMDGDPSNNTGSLGAVKPDGVTRALADMTDVSYMPYALEKLKRAETAQTSAKAPKP